MSEAFSQLSHSLVNVKDYPSRIAVIQAWGICHNVDSAKIKTMVDDQLRLESNERQAAVDLARARLDADLKRKREETQQQLQQQLKHEWFEETIHQRWQTGGAFNSVREHIKSTLEQRFANWRNANPDMARRIVRITPNIDCKVVVHSDDQWWHVATGNLVVEYYEDVKATPAQVAQLTSSQPAAASAAPAAVAVGPAGPAEERNDAADQFDLVQ